MRRRQFIAGVGVLALAVRAGNAAARGTDHAGAMAGAKARIRQLGERYKASGWSDPALKRSLATEARLFAGHHRALARLED